mmetsp:Transcript_4145/g.9187  ORF Transcript_4145/g.9187 Transcript_4145/m.9187 type:complete len:146 (-) Transcript_4145:90-527(-)
MVFRIQQRRQPSPVQENRVCSELLRAARQAPPPAAAPAAAPPAAAPSRGGGMMSGLAGSMMSGMATGVGFSMANRAVDAVMGPRQTEVVHRHEGENAAAPAVQQSAQPSKCQFEYDEFKRCMETYRDAQQCNAYSEMYKQCHASA